MDEHYECRESEDGDFRVGGSLVVNSSMNQNVPTGEIVLAFISGPLPCQGFSSEPMKGRGGEGRGSVCVCVCV